MPTYEYQCESNGRLVEVRHNMAERLSTWGELCQRAGISPGTTDPAAPVEKLISAGFINAGPSTGQSTGQSTGKSAGESACAASGCGTEFCGTDFCGAGACGTGD